jgi:hypothetical protein
VKRTYKAEVPLEVIEVVDPLLDRWQFLLPTWSHELLIGWNKANKGVQMEICTNLEYRWCLLTVFPAFLESTPAGRDEALRHEMIHALIEPLNILVHDLLQLAKGPGHKFLENQRERAIESTVCDLTRAIGNAYGIGTILGTRSAE